MGQWEIELCSAETTGIFGGKLLFERVAVLL